MFRQTGEFFPSFIAISKAGSSLFVSILTVQLKVHTGIFDGFVPHPVTEKMYNRKMKMYTGIDFSNPEYL